MFIAQAVGKGAQPLFAMFSIAVDFSQRAIGADVIGFSHISFKL